MAPHHWQQLKEILGEALERDGEDRTTFVAQRCGSDTALRHEVEGYLKNSGQTVEACAEKMRETLLHKLPSDRIGHRFGAYRIVQEIGRGGMGTVFLAARADGQFEKQVAIKLLKRGTDTDEIVRRFGAERRILAQLEHQSIARLLDAGTTEDGLPYFVMEYVSGKPITAFVREHGLTIQERLELFLKVCAAVERAHRDHIVHRDLKPTNILVTAEGEPKLLDFGIAKLLDDGDNSLDATATNQQRFTPCCVSPEQTRGEPVTIASDIYALGALLYEILADKGPHQFSMAHPSSEELARVVCEQEPLKPSLVVSDRERRRQLAGDLDNIALYALRKEPERRYPTVSEFAEDIRRYLAARPISARPNTRIYRAQRFFKRNKNLRLQLGAATAAILIAAGLLFGVSQGLLPFGQRFSSDRAWASSINDKSIAVLPFDSFNNEGDGTYFVDGVQDDILTDLAKVSDLKVTSRDAVVSYRGAGKKSAREIGRSLGVAHVLEGSVQRSSGRVRVNARLIDTRTSTQVWAEAYERKVDDLFALQSELAQAIVAQLKARLSPSEKAAIESRPTQDMEAYDLFLKARDLMSQFASEKGENWRQAAQLLERAIQRDPGFTLAYSLQSHAYILLYRYFDHTPERLAQAKRTAETACKLAPESPDSHLALAGYYYHGFRDYTRAQEELNRIAPTLRGKVDYLDMAQLTERRLGRWKDAVRDGEKAVSLNPSDPVLVSVLYETYRALKMYAEAEKALDNVIGRLPAESTTMLRTSKVDLAITMGDLDRAQAALEAVPSKMRWKTFMQATIALYRRQYAEAEQFIETAIAADSAEPAYHLTQGQILELTGKREESRHAFGRAKEILQQQLRERPDDPLLLGSLGTACAGLGEKEMAVGIARKAVDLVPSSSDSIDGPNCIGFLAQTYIMIGETDAALNELAKVVQVPNGIMYGDLLFNPGWDALRKDPRFEKLVAQAALPLKFE